jgi:hypothetical protein
VDQRDDGEAERRRKLELTGVVVRSFWCTRAKLGRLGALGGHGGALGALDRGWEAAVAAVDGKQALRRRSGEELHSGKRNTEEKKCLSE